MSPRLHIEFIYGFPHAKTFLKNYRIADLYKILILIKNCVRKRLLKMDYEQILLVPCFWPNMAAHLENMDPMKKNVPNIIKGVLRKVDFNSKNYCLLWIYLIIFSTHSTFFSLLLLQLTISAFRRIGGAGWDPACFYDSIKIRSEASHDLKNFIKNIRT